MSQLRKAVLGRAVKRSGLGKSTENYLPTKWSEYFDSEEKVETNNGSFNVYRKGNSGVKLVCLHGGGYSGLTWALFAVDIYEAIECQVIAIDLRGHGNTKIANETDLSLETLANDVVGVLNKIVDDTNSVVLIGHSMGGSVAVQCSQFLESVVGLCVIDVVEGTALDALSSMQSILRSRPTQFKSIQHAIQWCCKSGQTYNTEAAKVSMPGQIMNAESGKLAADECDTAKLHESIESSKPLRCLSTTPATINELDEDSSSSANCKPPLPAGAKKDEGLIDDGGFGPKYAWRIDLSKTEQFWPGWFKGLSQKFLDLRIPKLLLLANINGLDTALTVGQMQGKFQLQVLNKSGHAIHEDQPQRVADIIGSYLVKQKITTAKGGLVLSMPSC